MSFDAISLAFGDIVLVPFPFTDLSVSKRRPAVVISNTDYHARHRDILVMPVTSQLRGDARPDDVPINAWQEAGLPKPSAVKPVIATLEQSLVIRRLGRLTGADLVRLRDTLLAILAPERIVIRSNRRRR